MVTAFPAPVKQESQAVGFYRHLGFENAGSYENYLGNWFYMRKRLE